MPPAYVKPYVKRQKNDASDAEAICEAVSRANIRFVPTKTPEQQSGLVLHRTRHLFIRQQTSLINAIRAHCAEFGIVAPVGRRRGAALCHRQRYGRASSGDRSCLRGSAWRSATPDQTADSGVGSYDYSLAPVLRD
jgi:transposase